MVKNIRNETLPEVTYTNLGSLAHSVELEFPALAEAAWTGKISVKGRLGNQLAPSELREALAPANLEPYYTAAGLDAPTRCIGRPLCVWLR